MRPTLATALLGLLAPLLTVPGPTASAAGPATPPSADGGAAARQAPALVVRTKARGLNHPWDVKEIGGNRLLVTERDPARLTVVTGGRTRSVTFPARKVWTNGETGLMGLEVDPAFATNGRFYTCSGWRTARGHDIRVVAWRMNEGATRARLVKPLLTGLPTVSGRHGGCRLLIADNGALVVGTGDAAVGSNPRNKDSLGGKTLRIDRRTGKAWPQNPWAGSRKPRRFVLTYGHRNVQGLAQRGDGSLWSVEHGSDRDDEVNKLRAGGDYGWHPVPGYNESVPMTDQRLPGTQVGARWRSGRPTLATSGATFVEGAAWGSYQGALAVAALKAGRVLFIRFDKSGRNPRTAAPAALRKFGRLRTVTQRANGDLLVATDADGGKGRILVVRAR